jgi:hypothetical protein
MYKVIVSIRYSNAILTKSFYSPDNFALVRCTNKLDTALIYRVRVHDTKFCNCTPKPFRLAWQGSFQLLNGRECQHIRELTEQFFEIVYVSETNLELMRLLLFVLVTVATQHPPTVLALAIIIITRVSVYMNASTPQLRPLNNAQLFMREACEVVIKNRLKPFSLAKLEK